MVKAAINIRVERCFPKREGKTRWLLCPVNYACSDDLAFLPLKGGYLSLNPSPVHAILLFPRRAVSIRQPESSLSKWSLLKSLSAIWENKFVVTGGKTAGWIRVPVKKSREYALLWSIHWKKSSYKIIIFPLLLHSWWWIVFISFHDSGFCLSYYAVCRVCQI